MLLGLFSIEERIYNGVYHWSIWPQLLHLRAIVHLSGKPKRSGGNNSGDEWHEILRPLNRFKCSFDVQNPWNNIRDFGCSCDLPDWQAPKRMWVGRGLHGERWLDFDPKHHRLHNLRPATEGKWWRLSKYGISIRWWRKIKICGGNVSGSLVRTKIILVHPKVNPILVILRHDVVLNDILRNFRIPIQSNRARRRHPR